MTFLTSPASGTATPLAPDSLLTLVEIADLLGRDLKTIKTWRKANHWPQAVQDTSGRRTWRVPVTDLVAAGDIDAAQVVHVENELATRRESKQTQVLREQNIRLEEQLAAAEALADERHRTIALLQAIVTGGGAA